MMKFLKNLWNNIATILTALMLAIIVWVSSVVSADPNVNAEFSNPIEVQIVGLADDQTLVGGYQDTVIVNLGAPQSKWDQLIGHSDYITATIDVTDLGSGEYILPIDIEVGLSPVRVISVNPPEVKVKVENVVSVEKAVHAVTIGELATGYQTDELSSEDLWANVSGPESIIANVDQVVAVIDISGLRETVDHEVTLRALDEDGLEISGLDITPATTIVTHEISQSGGYRDVSVTVDIINEPDSGYRLTYISVFPTTVTLFSTDPLLIANMPGFVRTEEIDLSGLTEDTSTRVLLVLPEGVSLESEQKTVLVQIGVSAIESSATIKVPIQVIGLISGLEAILPYDEIELLVSGPLPVLDTLTVEDILMVINLSGYSTGTYLVTPQIESIPDDLVIDTIIPAIEVTIQSN
jgi:YbbR domain-containing protein